MRAGNQPRFSSVPIREASFESSGIARFHGMGVKVQPEKSWSAARLPNVAAPLPRPATRTKLAGRRDVGPNACFAALQAWAGAMIGRVCSPWNALPVGKAAGRPRCKAWQAGGAWNLPRLSPGIVEYDSDRAPDGCMLRTEGLVI